VGGGRGLVTAVRGYALDQPVRRGGAARRCRHGVYAFGFGVCIYLSMRVSGFLLVAIVLHGLTDPTTILATGGLDDGLFRGCGRVTRPNRDDTGSRAKLLPESLVPHNRKIVEISIIKIGSH